MFTPNIKRIVCFVFAAVFMVLGLSFNTAQSQDFEEWKENYLNEFKEFQNKYDKEFHEMLQNEWKEFEVELSPDFYIDPKPKKIPEVEETDAPDPKPETKESKKENPPATPSKEKAEKKEEAKTEKKTPSEEKQKTTQTDVEKKTDASAKKSFNPSSGFSATFEPNVDKAEVHSKQLNYFGTPIDYKYYAAYETQLEPPIDKKAISDFWKHLSTKDYPSFLKQVQEVRSKLNLNDFGYAQLLANIGDQIYGEGSSESTLFTWFMLTQSDFGTRIAYNKQGVYLLVKASPNVFQTTYFTIDGEKYYGLNFSESKSNLPNNLYTYEGKHPKSSEKEINLRFQRLPLLPQDTEQRTLNFTFRGTEHSIEVPVDKQIVNYFKGYPKADLGLYFNSQMEGDTHDQLIGSLKPLLEGKSTIEKVNLLLRFTQRSFEYQTDQEQFNTEKKMFPMETLYYPASDCDDRSILFAYLIDHLTELDYVVIRYPGHLTPAVHFPDEKPEGSKVNSPITHKGKSYYVTDPTYFGADAGMIMTKYQDTSPEEIFDL